MFNINLAISLDILKHDYNNNYIKLSKKELSKNECNISDYGLVDIIYLYINCYFNHFNLVKIIYGFDSIINALNLILKNKFNLQSLIKKI